LKAITNLCLLLWPLLSLAQESIEVIPLRNRTAEQVIPVLQPLVAPGGALTGQAYQLIVRTSPENLAQIRQALAAIDQPQRRLKISVRFDSSAVGTRVAGGESVDQQVQAMDGGRAYISTGQARFYSETATGFEVVPRIAGSVVNLEIYAQQENYVRGGAIQGQRASSVVSGRLGEWIELAGSDSAGRSLRSQRMWLMVEDLR